MTGSHIIHALLHGLFHFFLTHDYLSPHFTKLFSCYCFLDLSGHHLNHFPRTMFLTKTTTKLVKHNIRKHLMTTHCKFNHKSQPSSLFGMWRHNPVTMASTYCR